VSAPPLSVVEVAETLSDRGGIAPAAYRATFLADGAGGELGRGASSVAAVALEGRRRVRVGFGDGFARSRASLHWLYLAMALLKALYCEVGLGGNPIYLIGRLQR
jgi:hypothetical protein